MNKIQEFHLERKKAIDEMNKDNKIHELTKEWSLALAKYDYVYNLTWMGVPILQLSTDILAMQELIWDVKPDLIIETGLAYGGSIIFSASMLELLGGEGEVIGIDIDIREHNRKAIESHPMFKRIHLLEGSSIDDIIVEKVKNIASNKKSIMVILDSNHTHEHVLKELEIYSEFVTIDSYIIAYDTNIEFFHDQVSEGRPYRPWGVGNNPWTAVQEFIKDNNNFIIDKSIQNKIVLTSAPDGYLRRIK